MFLKRERCKKRLEEKGRRDQGREGKDRESSETLQEGKKGRRRLQGRERAGLGSSKTSLKEKVGTLRYSTVDRSLKKRRKKGVDKKKRRLEGPAGKERGREEGASCR